MSDTRPFTTLNPLKVKADYPKTYKSIVEWLKKSATEGNVLTEEMVHAFIYGNPRFLYDYFDDQDYTIELETADLLAMGRKKTEEREFERALQIQETRL